MSQIVQDSDISFHDLFRTMTQGVVYQNAEGKIISVNPAAEKILGLTFDQMTGRTSKDPRWRAIQEDGSDFPGENHPSMVALKTGKRVIGVILGVFNPKKETYRWISVNAIPEHREGERKAYQVYTTFEDITERRQAEEALQQSEERFRLAFHTNPDSINLNRASDGLYMDINEGFTNTIGYTREDVIGKTSLSLNIWKNPEDRKRLIDGLSKTGYVDNLEAQFVRKDKKVKVGLMSARLLQIGGENVILSITRDITGRKRIEESLRESEEKYRTILESIEEGCFEVDLTGSLTFVNDALCKNTGYSREELLGMNNRDYATPETAKNMYKVFNKVYQTGNPAKILGYEIYRKDGEKRLYELSASLIKDQNGNPIGFRGLSRDMTERAKVEAEKKLLESQLQQAQKMEAIGTLAGGIAHDFNNLLMGIQGRASIMLTDIDPSHPHVEHLKGIEDYVKSAADLNRQLLGFAKSGKYEVKPIDINALIEKNSLMFGRTKKEIKIHRKQQKDLSTVEADQGQIDQVLLNIYVNAWQAMPEGGDLYIQTENVVIDEKYIKPYQVIPGQYVKISITDTGVGMDMKTQQRIFDPFFTTKKIDRGTGLGLASAYGIIKNHGGFINVYSEKGEGTTFNIYLPATTKDVAQEQKFHEEVLKGTETILLVDDEDMILEVGQRVVASLGYNVLPIKGGKEAIEVYKKNRNKIDMVILDMIMPEMHGGEVFDKLKQINPDIKVLLSTGYSINGKATEILDRGCNGFIQKPFNTKELSKKIREILDKDK